MKITNYELRITRFSLRLCAFACLLVLSSAVFAQTEQPPAPAQPRSAAIPKPVERTLPNGLRVIVVERKNVPLVTASLMIKSGGEVDPQNLAGAADMTAELLTKGTKTRTATQIAQEIEFLGGSIESGAAWDFSSVTFRVMSDKLDKAMAIAADTVRNPTFAQEEIDRYKAQILDELSVNLKQPGTLASYVTNRVVFGDKQYSHPLGGTPETINRITQADLLKIHRTYFKPNNAILVVAGDIAPNTVFDLSQKHFGGWAKATVQKVMTERTGTQTLRTLSDKAILEKITVVDLPNSGQAAVTVAKKGILRSDKLYFPGIVANSVLGGGYSARLNQEIRIKRGLSYGARSDLLSRREGGVFSTRTQTKNESAAEVAEIMINEINRLAAEPISESELTPRKSVLTGDFSRDLETTGGLVQRIGELALYNLSLDEINSYIQNVQGVKDDAVRGFVKNLLGGSSSHIIIVGDSSKFLPDLQKRFPSVKVDVIPAAELDLNTATLRKAAAKPNGKQAVAKPKRK